MKKLLNPRGYLSWTQIDLWMRSPERYVRNYMYGEETRSTNRQDFGSKVATAQENGDETDDELINMLVMLLPRYPKKEHEIRVPFKTKDGTVELLGKLDQFHDKTLAFRDTKTGVNKWTQAKAEKLKQLDHYAALIYLKHKKLPPQIHLDWAETVDDDGTVTLTGKVESFEVKKTLADTLAYLGLVARVAREIDARYRAELKKMS
jgi:hypothetical protein